MQDHNNSFWWFRDHQMRLSMPLFQWKMWVSRKLSIITCKRPSAEPLFYCRSNICPWKWHSRHSCDFWFTFSLICEMYARVTKLGTQDVMWDLTNHRGWCLFQQVSTGWVTGLVSIPEGYMCIEDVCFWCSIEWLTIAISWGRNRVIQSGLGSCSLLSCWDPHPIAEIPSNPRSIPYHSPNSILTILQDSNTMLTKPPNSDQPLRPLTHYHHFLRTPNDLQEPQSHFCLHCCDKIIITPFCHHIYKKRTKNRSH